jgi:hypothetical protein
MFAILLGIGAAFIRRFFSNLKKKIFINWYLVILNVRSNWLY